MKIAMILPSLANKGPILVARDLCIEYKKMGHECSVFYFDDIVKWNCLVPQSGFHFGDRLIGMPLILYTRTCTVRMLMFFSISRY